MRSKRYKRFKSHSLVIWINLDLKLKKKKNTDEINVMYRDKAFPVRRRPPRLFSEEVGWLKIYISSIYNFRKTLIRQLLLPRTELRKRLTEGIIYTCPQCVEAGEERGGVQHFKSKSDFLVFLHILFNETLWILEVIRKSCSFTQYIARNFKNNTTIFVDLCWIKLFFGWGGYNRIKLG